MASRAEVERLRREADTIMTRIQRVDEALERARGESGDHWEAGTVELTLETPRGEPIDVALELETDAASAARRRYERASELEAELRRRERVDDRLDPLPADPLAYLVCYHLDAVGGNYPRSIAGHLDTERDRVVDLCEETEQSGLLERVESGTVKQRRVKAKQADEVRQHHTYYRLSREGDHLLRFLAERAGKLNALRHLPGGRRTVARLSRDGPGSPRVIADDLGESFEAVRHRCRALRRVGLLTVGGGNPEPGDGETTDGGGTVYATTATGEELLAELDG
ncbi:MAG: DUF2250 domain-containing protein [Haloarculaceae archaeon]